MLFMNVFLHSKFCNRKQQYFYLLVRALSGFQEVCAMKTMEALKQWPASWRHYVKITKSAHANSEILKAVSWSSQLCKDSIADENNVNEMSNNQRVK